MPEGLTGAAEMILVLINNPPQKFEPKSSDISVFNDQNNGGLRADGGAVLLFRMNCRK